MVGVMGIIGFGIYFLALNLETGLKSLWNLYTCVALVKW